VQTSNPHRQRQTEEKNIRNLPETYVPFLRAMFNGSQDKYQWSGAMPSCDGVAPDHSIAIQFKYSDI